MKRITKRIGIGGKRRPVGIRHGDKTKVLAQASERFHGIRESRPAQHGKLEGFRCGVIIVETEFVGERKIDVFHGEGRPSIELVAAALVGFENLVVGGPGRLFRRRAHAPH